MYTLKYWIGSCSITSTDILNSEEAAMWIADTQRKRNELNGIFGLIIEVVKL